MPRSPGFLMPRTFRMRWLAPQLALGCCSYGDKSASSRPNNYLRKSAPDTRNEQYHNGEEFETSENHQ